ncbi:MAG: SDR family NAD(P)-dependent oxidoreductase, partial [Actinomycetota bacterium]|nr:SDR family NAD(P)-dependent oxidoreductase [Actinomycetota bacterium]
MGKVCVITGASSGIGERTARDLAERGVRICAVARREERLAKLVADLGGEVAGHSYHVTDVSRRESVRALAAFVRERYGRCDVLVNNAGFSRDAAFDGPAAADVVVEVMETNFLGAVWCTTELLDLLQASAPSHVVNVASMAGRLAMGNPPYNASKFALVGWSEALHFQLAPRGIYVSSVEPGIIPTEGFPATAIEENPLLRFSIGTTEQVSAAIIDAIEKRKMQRVVPRWYYLLQIPRLLTP